MITRDDGGPAFARPGSSMAFVEKQDGASLRDYFAARAMQSHLWRDQWKNPFTPADLSCLAFNAYQVADAMLKARKA